MDELLNILFPPKCCICKINKNILCKNCITKCENITHRFCMICNKYSFDGKIHNKCLKRTLYKLNLEIFSAFYYKDVIRKCIKLSKYKARTFSPLKILTKNACGYSRNFNPDYKDYIVIPIPIHAQKYKERGYNQADIIAKQAAKCFKISVQTDFLLRVVYTQSQYKNTRKERYLNLKDAFAVNKKYTNQVIGKKFLLIDDLCTSGATLLEAANVLYQSGAFEVRCFTLAKKF